MRKRMKCFTCLGVVFLLMLHMSLVAFASSDEVITYNAGNGIRIEVYGEGEVIEFYYEETGEREVLRFNSNFDHFIIESTNGDITEGYRDECGNVLMNGTIVAEVQEMTSSIVMDNNSQIIPYGYDYPPVGFNTKIYETRYKYSCRQYNSAASLAAGVIAMIPGVNVLVGAIAQSCAVVWGVKGMAGEDFYLMWRGYANSQKTQAVDILYYYENYNASTDEYSGLMQRDVSSVFDLNW